MHQYTHLPLDFYESKKQILAYISSYNNAVFFDNNAHTKHPYHAVECLAACSNTIEYTALDKIEKGVFYISHINYNHKNETLQLSSQHADNHSFAASSCWRPTVVFKWNNKSWDITSDVALELETIFNQQQTIVAENIAKANIDWHLSETESEYLNTIGAIKNHIVEGDVYELNYCIQQSCTLDALDPLATFEALTQNLKAPFSVYYKLNEKVVLSASPERFLTLQNGTLASQPIKGTARRMSDDSDADMYQKLNLSSSVKERAEHLMIVDLMRNDLSRCSQVGTVRVDELMELYSFATVHQLISTVSGKVLPELSLNDIVNLTFPMGSMTGAPKKMACQLIDEYERTNRGIYSGSIGYCTAAGDFDYNVVIRSMVYNTKTGLLSLHTGSAITHLSDAQQEWDECMLKAEAIKKCVVIYEQNF
jgi:para-aminobenzoate synthetase component 1